MTDSPYDGDTAILYARVSTDDHDQDPQTQVRNMTKWCEANGVEILETFVEERSAKDTNRPGLQAALGYLTLNKVGILLAWSESRLSRDTDDMAKIVAICKTNRVRIRYVTADGINPEEGTGESDELPQHLAGGGREEETLPQHEAGFGISEVEGEALWKDARLLLHAPRQGMREDDCGGREEAHCHHVHRRCHGVRKTGVFRCWCCQEVRPCRAEHTP